MPAAVPTNPKATKQKCVILRTWDEAEKYFAKHLNPICHGPKGRPVYAHVDIQNLNVQLPENIALLMKDPE